MTDLEDKLIGNNKDLHAAQDLNQALQHEFKVVYLGCAYYHHRNSFTTVIKYTGMRQSGRGCLFWGNDLQFL